MYNTNELLDKLYADTEQLLTIAVKNWQNLTAQKLSQKPHAQAWSAAQCVEHLNLYGRYYLPAIEAAIAQAEKKQYTCSPTFQSGWLGNYFYNMMLPTEGGVKRKMKTPELGKPAENPNPSATIAEFIDQQEKMLQLLERARTVNIGKVRVPISLSKFVKLKLGDTFLFMIAHHQRHTQQAERTLKR